MDTTTTTPTIKLGYNLAGCEEAFEKHLSETLAKTGAFTFMEIGTAEGTTLLAVSEYLNRWNTSTGGEPFAWQTIGLDLIGGPFFNANKFSEEVTRKGLSLTIHAMPPGACIHGATESNTVSVILSSNPREAIKATKEVLDFVLIDGCHGAACVEADFLAVEDKVYSGGIVAFHDACEEDQGQHFQQHCGEPINVRKALERLELYQPLPFCSGMHCMRSGWKFLEEVHGDKTANPPGNGMIFFQKE